MSQLNPNHIRLLDYYGTYLTEVINDSKFWLLIINNHV
jgi:hypothetical protein